MFFVLCVKVACVICIAYLLHFLLPSMARRTAKGRLSSMVEEGGGGTEEVLINVPLKTILSSTSASLLLADIAFFLFCERTAADEGRFVCPSDQHIYSHVDVRLLSCVVVLFWVTCEIKRFVTRQRRTAPGSRGGGRSAKSRTCCSSKCVSPWFRRAFDGGVSVVSVRSVPRVGVADEASNAAGGWLACL